MADVINLEAYRQERLEMDIFISVLTEQYEAIYHEPPEPQLDDAPD